MVIRRKGRTRHTTYIGSFSPARVRVTRRHHPLLGQDFEVLTASSNNVVVGLRDGSRLKLPRGWTDAGGAEVDRDSPESVVTLDGLRRVLELVATMKERRS